MGALEWEPQRLHMFAERRPRSQTVTLEPVDPMNYRIDNASNCELIVHGTDRARLAMRAVAMIEDGVASVPFLPADPKAEVRCGAWTQAIDPTVHAHILEAGRSLEVQLIPSDAVTLDSAWAQCGDRKVETPRRRAPHEPADTTLLLDGLSGSTCTVTVTGSLPDENQVTVTKELGPRDTWAVALDWDGEDRWARATRQTIHVVDTEGRPVPGARLMPMPSETWAIPTGLEIPPVLQASSTTDESGRASLRPFDDTVQVAVLANGHGYSLHPLPESTDDPVSLVVDDRPATALELDIVGLPEGTSCSVGVTQYEQLQIEVPVIDGEARLWTPVEPSLSTYTVRCGGWRRRFDPAVGQLHYERPRPDSPP